MGITELKDQDIPVPFVEKVLELQIFFYDREAMLEVLEKATKEIKEGVDSVGISPAGDDHYNFVIHDVEGANSMAETINDQIELILDKTKALATVASCSKQRCGQSHLVAAFDYLISEACEIRNRLVEIKRDLRKGKK